MGAVIRRVDELNTLCPGWKAYEEESRVFASLGIKTPMGSFMLLAQEESEKLLLLVSPDAHNSQEFYMVGTKLLREYDVQVLQAESSILRILVTERDEDEKEKVTQQDQQLFHEIIEDAVAQGSSDLMIHATRKGLYEVLYDIDTIPEYIRDLTESEVKGMMRYYYQRIAKNSVEETTHSMESAQFAGGTIMVNSEVVRLRYQSKEVFPYGMDFVIRLLNQSKETGFDDVEDLQLTDDQTAALRRIQNREKGAVAIAGETNSGKSTTAKVQLESIKRDRPDKVVRTLESPVEYLMRFGIRQHEVRESKSADSANAMDQVVKEFMRMNFKLAYVAELRGVETARLFVNILESGHGVYLTLHTSGVFTVYDRLERQGIDKYITTQAGNINALIYQKRLPQLCEHCKVPFVDHHESHPELLSRLEMIGVPLDEVYLKSSTGCNHCRH
ncbi:hypothetical protein AB835_08095 [Candidatus Endobugula sertula]|uniref:Bacterial type II secretion system protein E domain-containing protein n=1 Tax=Candidatus Endobugula sertula TaxID=62101 RepID=A0A1D2QPT0_9GAMM|nr:hypothetical protein AB835_08095 [Candidatus Endobugula sertula]